MCIVLRYTSMIFLMFLLVLLVGFLEYYFEKDTDSSRVLLILKKKLAFFLLEYTKLLRPMGHTKQPDKSKCSGVVVWKLAFGAIFRKSEDLHGVGKGADAIAWGDAIACYTGTGQTDVSTNICHLSEFLVITS